MIINHKGALFETEQMEMIGQKLAADRTVQEGKLFSEFCILVYERYVNIREVVNDNRCRKLNIEDLRKRLDINTIQRFLEYSSDEIEFYIDFACKYIQIVR
ncbi:hypothetical protein [Enterococcus wangshanyuanii]|uniref:Uncharacterized protein n=1 Tax=Enterococcus wangshanyuanii TaxID=2005703 RepID=A0ABQ1NWG3_9ENTE|nr:hypothetical protein [Enterococcus wangshanyuanii]GGC84343.1 hypothetical protein GCM10011573_12460 [Enterococcus wangshanyuanii]